jgi:uncharacterized protein YpiB (UPF0302 family)
MITIINTVLRTFKYYLHHNPKMHNFYFIEEETEAEEGLIINLSLIT